MYPKPINHMLQRVQLRKCIGKDSADRHLEALCRLLSSLTFALCLEVPFSLLPELQAKYAMCLVCM